MVRDDNDTATSLGSSTAGSPGMPVVEVIGRDFEGWTPELRAEFAANSRNYQVGRRLLSETDRLKVWEIRLAPGERMPAHRHVLDYFWTALTDGASIQHTEDGTTTRATYTRGNTRHFTFGPGESLYHDLNNAGTSELAFITVEHCRAADNRALWRSY